MLVFVVPHQFVRGVCDQLRGKLGPNCKAISLIKGLDVSSGLELISEVIRSSLNMDVSVLMVKKVQVLKFGKEIWKGSLKT